MSSRASELEPGLGAGGEEGIVAQMAVGLGVRARAREGGLCSSERVAMWSSEGGL